MIRMFITAFGVLLLVGSASGAPLASVCTDINKCVEKVSRLTGDKYVIHDSLKMRFTSTHNLDLTKDNATLLLTSLLYHNGYTRVPLGEKGVYAIMRSREARDRRIPVIYGSWKQAPELPNTYDLVTLVYELKHPEMSDEIARTMRSFMPANSRIIPYPKRVLLTDGSRNLGKLVELVRSLDIEPTDEYRKQKERSEKHQDKDLERLNWKIDFLTEQFHNLKK